MAVAVLSGLAGWVGGPALAAGGERVRVLSTTDRPQVQPLIDDFERRHPGMHVDYVQLGSVELFERFLAEGGRSADVLWSSAMDLQIKLVNDGHAAHHVSPHASRLPRWAVWKQEAYSTTCEPVGMVVHRQLWESTEVPRTRSALAALLGADPPRFRQRVVTYDIARAGLGFLLASHDAMASEHSWALMRALGQCQAVLHDDTHSMLDAVSAGRALLAYNVLGPYAESWAQRQPELAVIYPSDYTLVASRVAFVARQAPNPVGARLWLDHLLSPQGQRVLAVECGLYSVIDGVDPSRSADGLRRRLGQAGRPIALGPGLLAHLDRSKKVAFQRRWDQALRPR